MCHGWLGPSGPATSSDSGRAFFNKALQVTLAIIILVIFPLYIGLGFFRQAFTQEEWTRYVSRATLLLLFAAPQLGFLPGVVWVLTSENIHGDTRSRIFIAQLSNAISLLLLTSLFIWSIGGAGQAVPILGGNFVFSPTVLYVMLAYVIAVIFIPYLVGHYRSKDWMAHLEAERSDIVDELSKDLMSPNWARVDNALAASDQKIEQKIDRFQNGESMRPARQIAESDKSEDFIPKIALRESFDRDPRCVHIKLQDPGAGE
jgi:hypothetical protein